MVRQQTSNLVQYSSSHICMKQWEQLSSLLFKISNFHDLEEQMDQF